MLETTEQSWDSVFDTNLKGPFFLHNRRPNHMIAARRAGRIARGTIVNISSISAFAVSTNRAEYCLTKAALQMMTGLFATRLADDNIYVYEVCPGIIATDMTAPVKEKYDRLIAQGLTPIRRWGQPEDVARAVVSLGRAVTSRSAPASASTSTAAFISDSCERGRVAGGDRFLVDGKGVFSLRTVVGVSASLASCFGLPCRRRLIRWRRPTKI